MAGQKQRSGGKRANAGRTPGAKNKATIEREELPLKEMRAAEAEAALRANAALPGRPKKLAKEVLDEFMHLFAGMAAFYQPTPPGVAVANRNASETKFVQYARLAVACAESLADFQSARFKAIMVTAAPADNARPGDDAKVVNMLDQADQSTASGAYLRMIKGAAA